MADSPLEPVASAGEVTGGIQSLDAALRVLAEMARRDGAVALSELARACDMPVSKTHRYLASFIHAGLARQNGRSGTYDLGPAAIELGLAALHRYDFVNAVADGLPGLAAGSGLTALLCVWSDAGPTVVRWERGPSFFVTALGLGSTLPLLNSATGRVFLAFLPEAMTHCLRARELARGTESRTASSDKVSDEAGARSLAESVRAAGYATVDGRVIPGLVAMAAPVLDWQAEAQAVVTLLGTDPEDIRPDSPALASLRAFCAAHAVPRPAGRDTAVPSAGARRGRKARRA